MHYINAIHSAIRRINKHSKLKVMINTINNNLGSKFVDAENILHFNKNTLHYSGTFGDYKVYTDYSTFEVFTINIDNGGRYKLLTKSQLVERDRVALLREDIKRLETVLRNNPDLSELDGLIDHLKEKI